MSKLDGLDEGGLATVGEAEHLTVPSTAPCCALLLMISSRSASRALNEGGGDVGDEAQGVIEDDVHVE